MADPKKSGPRKAMPPARTPPFAKWSKIFLSKLAATSNVSASARAAGINSSTAYDRRRSDLEFNRAWQEALCEGYQHLEMETLARLREGEIKPSRTAKRGVRTFDNATAIRLLTAHRESAARQQAVRDNADAETILASIDAKLDRMRERAAAAKKAKCNGNDAK